MEAKIKITSYQQSFSGPDKPIRKESYEKELIVDEGSIIDDEGNLLLDKVGSYITIDKITAEQMELTAYGFPNQSSPNLVDVDGSDKGQHFFLKRFQQRSLNIPLLGGSISLTILFLGIYK